jgi:hypothetical protein
LGVDLVEMWVDEEAELEGDVSADEETAEGRLWLA